jgi:hypothetical protein
VVLVAYLSKELQSGVKKQGGFLGTFSGVKNVFYEAVDMM